MARLETTALSSFTLSSRVSSGSASRKEPHEQHRGNISPRAHRGRVACSSLCTAALQLQSRVPHRVTAPIPIGFGVDASLSLATLLPLLVVSLASTRENSGCAWPCTSPSMGGNDPHAGTPQNPEQGVPAHLSLPQLSGRCPRRSCQRGAGCGTPGCGRPGSRHGAVSASPGSGGPGSRLCFSMEHHHHPSERKESRAPECSLRLPQQAQRLKAMPWRATGT